MQKRLNKKAEEALLSAQLAETLGDGSSRTKSQELEESIIGLCFKRPSSISLVTCSLAVEDFADPRYRVFYSYITECYAKGRFPDEQSCLALARRNTEYDVDPDDYRAAMDAAIRANHDIDIESCCSIVHDLCVVRKILGFAERIKANIQQGKSSAELVASAESFIKTASNEIFRESTLLDIDQWVTQWSEGVETLAAPKEDLLETPFAGLNELIGGFGPGELVIVGARPGMGKTALLCQFGYFTARLHENKNVMFFSYEMSSESIWRRIVCNQKNIRSGDMRKNEMTDAERNMIRKFIRSGEACRNFKVSAHRGGKTALSLRSELARARDKFGPIDMVGVDYLQKMDSNGSKRQRNEEVSEIARALKDVAMEFSTRMIVAAQVGRVSENRVGGDNRPQNSDLRESGDIEAEADIILFPHRPSVYWKKTGPPPDDEIIVGKHRHGATGVVPVRYNADFFRFENLG